MNKEKDNLILWLQKDTDINQNIMDHVLEIYEKISLKLKNNKIKFNKDYYIVLIKLCSFLYENSNR